MAAGHLLPLPDGYCGRKAIHLMDDDDRKRVPKMDDLYVDIGAKTKKDAEKLVSLGDAGVFVQPFTELANNRIVSMAFDNKMGTWIVTEVLRLLHKQKLDACIVGVSTVQEEIGLRGARVAAYTFNPDIGLVLDATPANDLTDREREVLCLMVKGMNNNEIAEKLTCCHHATSFV